jgi:hypothetical protein
MVLIDDGGCVVKKEMRKKSKIKEETGGYSNSKEHERSSIFTRDRWSRGLHQFAAIV